MEVRSVRKTFTEKGLEKPVQSDQIGRIREEEDIPHIIIAVWKGSRHETAWLVQKIAR